MHQVRLDHGPDHNCEIRTYDCTVLGHGLSSISPALSESLLRDCTAVHVSVPLECSASMRVPTQLWGKPASAVCMRLCDEGYRSSVLWPLCCCDTTYDYVFRVTSYEVETMQM